MSIKYPDEIWVVCLRADKYVAEQARCFDVMGDAIEYAGDASYIARYKLKAPGTGSRDVHYDFTRDPSA